jgi:hypothetical protein
MKNILFFITGATIGSIVTWKLIENKYKKIADEEIESVKETFKKRLESESLKTVNEKENDDESLQELSNGEIVNYNKIIKSNDYNISEDDNYTVNLENEEEERHIPYSIKPEEFGMIEHYGTKTLILYRDNVLTDEIDNIINNRDEIIGPDALNHIGEYEEDAVYIRDIDNEMDYEILRNENFFSEIMKDDR